MSLLVLIQKNAFPSMAGRLPKAVGDANRDSAQEVVDEWKANIVADDLIDTGAYLASVHVEDGGIFDAAAVSDKNYSVYLEYGTSRGIRAYGVATRAGETVRERHAKRIAKALEGLG